MFPGNALKSGEKMGHKEPIRQINDQESSVLSRQKPKMTNGKSRPKISPVKTE